MDKLSFELKRINNTLLIIMVVILFGSCMRMDEIVVPDEPIEVISERATEEMVDLGDGYFGIYTGYELKIYYYDTEKNELILKKTKYLSEDEEEE